MSAATINLEIVVVGTISTGVLTGSDLSYSTTLERVTDCSWSNVVVDPELGITSYPSWEVYFNGAGVS